MGNWRSSRRSWRGRGRSEKRRRRKKRRPRKGRKGESKNKNKRNRKNIKKRRRKAAMWRRMMNTPTTRTAMTTKNRFPTRKKRRNGVKRIQSHLHQRHPREL